MRREKREREREREREIKNKKNQKQKIIIVHIVCQYEASWFVEKLSNRCGYVGSPSKQCC